MPRVDLEGSSSIITGGASGIGEASARLLADAGSRVVIADLNEERGQAVASELGGLFVRCDVTSIEDADTTVAAASEMGPLRALVNSAGLGMAGRTISRDNQPLDLSQFEFVIRVNLIGSFNMLSRAAGAMAATEPMDEDGQRGAIVNMASAAAFDGQIGQAAYSASKGGIVGMTLPIARDLADKGVRVVTIAPGIFQTPLLDTLPDKVKQALTAAVPFPQKLGTAAEYAALARHIVENVMLNGESIRLDGAIRMAPR